MFFPHKLTTEDLETFRKLLRTNKDAGMFVLGNPEMPAQKRSWLASQLICRKKAEKKHPDFYERECFYSPKSIEQSTSTAVAKAKAAFANIGKSSLVCDLTGGMGAETVAFAEVGATVHYIEPDSDLFFLSSYNFSMFPFADRILLHNTNAETFLQENTLHFDLALLDPDRRAQGKRDFSLEKSSPNPILLEKTILSSANKLWIKHSPLTDLQYLKEQFAHITTLCVISLKNEVKEVSSLHSSEVEESPKTICICIDYKGKARVYVFEPDNTDATVPLAEKCGHYFFEPDKAFIKAKCADVFAAQNQFQALSLGIPYYTTDKLSENLSGRVFEVMEEFPFNEKKFKTYLKTSKIKKASVGARGFVLKAEEIERKFGLKPDNKEHFFFYRNKAGKKMCVRANLINPAL